MRTLQICLIPLLLTACTGSAAEGDGTGGDGGDGGTTDSGDGDTGDGPTPACWEQDSDLSEFALLMSCYGTMRTVAGKGDIPDKSDNGWEAEFEGGDALEAELSRPHMTMADAAGNLYIADKDAHAIRKVDTAGTITTVAGTSRAGDGTDDPSPGTEVRLSSPNGLWAQPDGRVYIHDMDNNKIRRLDPDGTLETLFETTGSGTGRGLWVAEDESLAYVSCGSVIRKWTPEDGVETLATGFVSLGNLVVDPDGHVVATDRSGHEVVRVTAEGDVERIAGTGRGLSNGGTGDPALEVGLAEVRGVWFHPLGGYFLATHDGGDLWYVDTDGIIHLVVEGDNDDTTIGGEGENISTEGKKISEPRAITMHADGRLILTENDRGFVRIVALAE